MTPNGMFDPVPNVPATTLNSVTIRFNEEVKGLETRARLSSGLSAIQKALPRPEISPETVLVTALITDTVPEIKLAT